MLDELESQRLGRPGAHRQAVRLRRRRRHRPVPGRDARARARGRARRARALRPHPRAAVPDASPRSTAPPRRRRRDRAALRRADDLALGPSLRHARGLPRALPRLGRHAAAAAARRRSETRSRSSSRTRCARTGCSTRRRRSSSGSPTGCSTPVEFLDDSIAHLRSSRRRHARRSRTLGHRRRDPPRARRAETGPARAPQPYAHSTWSRAPRRGRSRRATARRRTQSPSFCLDRRRRPRSTRSTSSSAGRRRASASPTRSRGGSRRSGSSAPG